MVDTLVIRDSDIESALTSLRSIRAAFENDVSNADALAAAVGHSRLAREVTDFAGSWRINRNKILESIDALYKGLQTIDDSFTKVDDDSARAMADDGLGQGVQSIAQAVTAGTRTVGGGVGDTSGLSSVDRAAVASTSTVGGGSWMSQLDRPGAAVAPGTSSVQPREAHASLDDIPAAQAAATPLVTLQRIEQVLERIEALLQPGAGGYVVGAAVAAALATLIAACHGSGGSAGRPGQQPGRPGPAQTDPEQPAADQAATDQSELAPTSTSAPFVHSQLTHHGLAFPAGPNAADSNAASPNAGGLGPHAGQLGPADSLATTAPSTAAPSGTSPAPAATGSPGSQAPPIPPMGAGADSSSASVTSSSPQAMSPVATQPDVTGPGPAPGGEATPAREQSSAPTRAPMMAGMGMGGGGGGGDARPDAERAAAAKRALAQWRQERAER